MANSTHIERDPLYVVAPSTVTKKTKRFGHLIVWGTFILMFLIGTMQFLHSYEKISFGFVTWRPLLYSYFGYVSRLLLEKEKKKDALNLTVFTD